MSFFKKAIILLYLILFGLNIISQFSENIFSELLLIRSRYFLENNKKNILIKFPSSHWKSLENKREILYQNNYYDVKEIIFNKEEVTLLVVEDSFENILKFVEKSIFENNEDESKKDKMKNKKNFDFFCLILSQKKKHSISENEKINTTYLFSNYYFLTKRTLKPPIF